MFEVEASVLESTGSFDDGLADILELLLARHLKKPKVNTARRRIELNSIDSETYHYLDFVRLMRKVNEDLENSYKERAGQRNVSVVDMTRIFNYLRHSDPPHELLPHCYRSLIRPLAGMGELLKQRKLVCEREIDAGAQRYDEPFECSVVPLRDSMGTSSMGNYFK
jgi:hypothetical protein